MEDRLEERMSSGAWQVAEQRAAEHGRAPTRRATVGDVSGLQSQLGLPHRIERLVAIERETERMRERLEREWRELAVDHEDDAAFADAWRTHVKRVSFLEVNELVETHNEWFPLEASLRWDLTLGDYRAPFGIPWRKHPLDAAWALDQFPPSLAAVQAS